MMGLGSRGGQVIGTTRSGKPIYERGGSTRGWTHYDHHDAYVAHEQAGNKALADEHYATWRKQRERARGHGVVRRMMGFLHEHLGDTGTLQTDLLRCRTLLFGKGGRGGVGGVAPTPRPPAQPAQHGVTTVLRLADKRPLAEQHDRYFHVNQAHATVPLHTLVPAKTVQQEKGGIAVDRAENHLRAAYHGREPRRAPITVRKRADGNHDIIDGNATYHAAKRHGWKTMPVTFQKGAKFAAPGPGPGEHTLGKTKSGRPVYASGAEVGKYNDQDHTDAATLHARAAAYHEDQAALHAKTRDHDRDWKRSEQHHGEHERHSKLRDHHFERVQDHLAAAGRAEEGEFDGTEIRNRRPMDKKRVAKIKAEMAARTHHSHPGGHSDADMAEYGTFGIAPKKGKPVAA